ncbi:unnamed protein product, partial [marine sediment metagenome]
MAFPGDYTLYQIVTIDSDLIPSTQSNFTTTLTEANFVKAGADIFDSCRSDGGDIRITLSDGTTQLARRIVEINTSTKKMVIKVLVPSLASATDPVIWVWYNGTDTEPAEDATYGSENAYHSTRIMSQSMSEDPSGSAPQMIDGTSNSIDGTSNGGMTSGDVIDGQIGNALNFDGTDYIDCGDNALTDFDGNDSFSLVGWFRSSSSVQRQTVFDKRNTSGSFEGYFLRVETGGAATFGFYDASSNLAEVSGTTTCY